MKKEEVDNAIAEIWEKSSDYFHREQIEKRSKFFERVHAAFILNTRLNEFGILKQENLQWLLSAYPKSTIKTGTDQGASYYVIEPKF